MGNNPQLKTWKEWSPSPRSDLGVVPAALWLVILSFPSSCLFPEWWSSYLAERLRLSSAPGEAERRWELQAPLKLTAALTSRFEEAGGSNENLPNAVACSFSRSRIKWQSEWLDRLFNSRYVKKKERNKTWLESTGGFVGGNHPCVFVPGCWKFYPQRPKLKSFKWTSTLFLLVFFCFPSLSFFLSAY